MSSGGGSQTTTSSPWSPVQPYLLDVLQKAQKQYGTTAGLFTDPSQNFDYGKVTGALGNTINGSTPFGSMAASLAPGTTRAIQDQLSGQPDYSAVNGAIDAANTQQWNQFYNQVVPQLNQRASFLGNPSGAIKDLNSAVSNIGQNQSLNAQQAYLSELDQAKARQASAAGLGATISQGAGSQSIQGAGLYGSLAALPNQNLLDYANAVRSVAPPATQTSQTQGPGGLIGGLGNVVQGIGLAGQLSGGIGSLAGGLGKLFGSFGSPSSPYQDQRISGGYGNDISNQYPWATPDWNQLVTDPSTLQNPYGGNIDLSFYNQNDPGWGFDGAGGQAAEPQGSVQTYQQPASFDAYQAEAPGANTATSSTDNVGTLGTIGAGLGIAGGLASGKPTGYASAGLQGAQLGAKTGLFGGNASAVNTGAGYGMNALGIYSGLKQGGVVGDASAAVNAAQLGARAGAFGGASGAVGTAAGYAAIPLSLYNEVNNWQSGATGQDALGGASTGAAVGTAVLPGIGTAVGAFIGGAAGALSSVFGNGRVDPENKPFESYTQAFNKAPAAQQGQIAGSLENPYVPLGGYFDLRSNQLKGQNPLYQAYGRQGEQKFTNDLIGKVQQGKEAGITDPAQMWNTVVQPWVNSFGTWQDSNKNALLGLMQNMTGQVMSGTYEQNFKAIGGDSPFAPKLSPAALGQALAKDPSRLHRAMLS